MEVKVSNKHVVLKLPIDTLVYAFNFKEDNQEQYKVKNKKRFAEGIAHYLQNYSSNGESGLTVFQEVLDEIFDEMVCNAEDYIKELQEEE
ncbi:hypothetical protein PACILC2_21100 [Paenibacillus cisolokensis]|uniref:Phage protein n=1 Tax=Paenibacillus cisolokensis TaxID=1658519 RepID=A0ABQ4N5V0_9BACL|nr:hypothetical protein [Paenibacillus cisolokensis]GIQ63542.1 hypothetical protein PACILC2_21100 [Paenibacillus cisolokensis]